MDPLISFFVYLLILFASLSFVFLLYKPKSCNQKLPPGSKGWPIIGENLEFLKAARKGNPEKFFNDRKSKYSPEVFRTSLFGENVVVFCGASGNKFLFKSENKYVSTWWPRSVIKALLLPDDLSDALRVRGILTEFLKPEALRHHITIMDSMAKEHLEIDWCPNNQIKAYPNIRKFTFALGLRLLTSQTDTNYVARLYYNFALLNGGIFSVPINFPGTSYYRAVKGRKFILEELSVLVRLRKAELLENKDTAKQDLLTRFLVASQEEIRSLSERQVAERLLGLLIGSFDTISTTLTAILKYLAEHSDVYKKVLEEQMDIAKSKDSNEDLLNWEDVQKMKYSCCVACEAMRLMPSAPGAFREAITDFTYAGYTIPKGWKTCWSVFSTHKNPNYFSDPEKFEPSRFEGSGPAPYTFVPFGGGARICPGREYARLEILIFMHNLVTKLRWEKVFPHENILFKPLPVPENGLELRIQPL
ncbi:hypothetical protein K2173_009811 [Erythroxylum novogranatense]|uniref:Cytochrome P450 n=1 Tax=Erythroxylum novogranatense TaxID=1862640 RepID=A0AAV8T090_9ROSI|nr:hypothetical protein K2173_009811 [Erythroxylum novogranatense]